MSRVVIVAIGETDPALLRSLGECLWRIYGLESRVLTSRPDPAHALDAQRQQYSSTRLLVDLLAIMPPGEERILGVTERDLFIPMLSYVFGHAQFKGRAALISLARLRQEFYGLPANAALAEARATKEAVHEIGHTLGLTHCPNASCPMSLSNTIRQVDAKSEELCPSCSLLLEDAYGPSNESQRTNTWRI